MTEKEQDTNLTLEELDRMADEFVSALLSEIQSITPEEIAKRAKAEPADTDILIPFVPTETEHIRGGKLVKKVSIETGGGIDEDGNPIPLDVADTDDFTETTTERFFDEQALAALDDTEREIIRRRRQGESYAALARDFGYKSAGGMQKRVVRIQAKMKAAMNPGKS